MRHPSKVGGFRSRGGTGIPKRKRRWIPTPFTARPPGFDPARGPVFVAMDWGGRFIVPASGINSRRHYLVQRYGERRFIQVSPKVAGKIQGYRSRGIPCEVRGELVEVAK